MTYDPRFSWNEEENPGELQGEQRASRKKTGRGGGLQPRLVPTVVVIAGLLLFAGIVWYAYSWGRSDGASEAIPVVQAPEGAEKERPDNPGGMEIPYQDTLVLNPGNSEGEDGSVERLLPPPEEPVERSEAAQLAETAEGTSSEDGESEEQTETEAPQESQETAGDTQEAAEASVDSDERDASEPGTQLGTEEDAAPSDAEEDSAEMKAPEPAVEEAEAGKTEEADVQETADSSQAVAGAYRIQLAAVRSNEAAEAEWQRLQGKHEALLGSLSLNVERADLGEQGVYYRIQAGPLSDEAAAKSLCSELQAQNQACLVRSPQ